MKIVSLILVFLLSSCATKFVKEENCSPKALEYLNGASPTASQLSESQLNESYEQLKIIFNSYRSDFEKCYQEKILDKGIKEKYNVCVVVGLNNEGKQEFLSVEDQRKGLNTELFQCISNKIKAEDFTKFKGNRFRVLQPYNFYPVYK